MKEFWLDQFVKYARKVNTEHQSGNFVKEDPEDEDSEKFIREHVKWLFKVSVPKAVECLQLAP
jgi:hypothetical protein